MYVIQVQAPETVDKISVDWDHCSSSLTTANL